MIRPRRLADIAKDLRRPEVWSGTPSLGIADELDALDARWPTADEIAEARLLARSMRLSGCTGWAGLLDAFLDRLDPPEPQADDDVDPWALLAALVGPCPSVLEHVAAVRAARAALDARKQS